MTKTKPKIESGVPIPYRYARSRDDGWVMTREDWEAMQPGQSVFRPNAVTSLRLRTEAKEIVFSGNNIRDMFPDREWTLRMATEDGVRGVRIWRVS